MLTFAVLPDGVATWFVDSTGNVQQSWADLPSTRSAVQTVAALSADAEAPVAAIKGGARRLGKLLLDPFSNRLNAISKSGTDPLLLIDADDFLAGVPWPLVENSKGEPLIERYSIVRTFGPGGSAEAHRTISVSSNALVFADPELGEATDEFPRMVDAREEGKRTAARFRNSLLLEGSDASRDAFLRDAPHFQLLHFEGHGMSNGGFGALVLSGKPPFVDAEQISAVDLSRLDLAVLAGCSTGLGFQTGSASADTLVRGFLDAGTARVLAASWDTDSFASRQLMEQFYDKMLGGATAASALRQAMLALRARPGTSHPSSWAAFQLYGQP
jgi:CHAT domain-containing protein